MQVDQAPGVGPRAPDPADQRDDEGAHGPPYPHGAKPVVFLTFVEDDLQAAGPYDQEAEADVVECADFGVFDVRRIVDEAGDEDDRQDADRDVDVEGIAPAEGVGQPAAEGGSEHRGHDDAETIGGHGHGALGGGKALEQDRLRQGLQGASAGSLEHTGQEDDAEGRGRSAEEGGDGEDEDAGEQKALASEAAGKPVAGRQDDGIGDQVAGQHPGGFGVGGREAAGDVGEGHRGDGGVQNLHEGWEHDGNRHQPRVYALGEGVASLGLSSSHTRREESRVTQQGETCL